MPPSDCPFIGRANDVHVITRTSSSIAAYADPHHDHDHKKHRDITFSYLRQRTLLRSRIQRRAYSICVWRRAYNDTLPSIKHSLLPHLAS
jgi:hypothetical protein